MTFFNPTAYKDNLLFIPLGGSCEIGMNINLYQYKGKWIIADFGAGFADDQDMPGIDMMVADISFLHQCKPNILGLILTHAHEDHLGGIQYLWDEIECPIFATTFTANFLKGRLADFSFKKKVPIHETKPGELLKLDPFQIQMIPLTHSAPEMQALFIKTDAGNVFHTGDWKFDNDPIIGEAANENLIKECANQGVTALVCDSTNIFNPGQSGSEGELKDTITDLVKGYSKMVVITTFASNLARLDTLFNAAYKTGRKVVLAGRSLHRMFLAAKESGYFENFDTPLSEQDIGNYRKEELLVIATGCQGEPLAAVTKMASGNHNYINLDEGDCVIFSSKIIPGNEKKIFKLFNTLVKKKIEVITEKDHFVHVSGHPCVDELKRMYELTKPKIAIPVHGESVHLHEHVKLAKSLTVPHAIEVENGTVVKIDPISPSIVGKVKTGYLGVDGNYLLPSNSPVIHMRRKIRNAGIIIATIILDKSGRLQTAPIISTPGCLDKKDDTQLIYSLSEVITEEVNSRHSRRHKIHHDSIENAIKSIIRRFIKMEIGKFPAVEVNIQSI